MLLKHPLPVAPCPMAEFIWEPFDWKEYAISLAWADANFAKQDTQLKASTHSTTSSNANSVLVWYNLHWPDTNELVIVGSEVVSLDGLCPAFNACPNPNIFQHHFGIEFYHEGNSYVQAISPYKFICCFGFINQMTYCLSHPTYKFAMDAAMPARTSSRLLKQAHSHLMYLQHANSEVFLPNQFAAPAAMKQAFVNSAIKVQLPSKEQWIQAYSDDMEMSIIHDLVTNPSKMNNLTLSMANYNYWAPLRNSQIMLEDKMLIYCKPIRGSSYTCLQLVLAAFYNIIFIAFHANAIRGHLNAFHTLHHICVPYYWPGIFSYIKRMCSTCPGCALANPTRSISSKLVYNFLLKCPFLYSLLTHICLESILASMVLKRI
jgi:hypothetical protein